MADESKPEEVPVVAPVVEAPVVAPAAEAAPQLALALETPAPEPAAIPEVVEPPKTAERTPSLLETADIPGTKVEEPPKEGDKPAEEKPVEPPKADEKPVVEAKPDEKKAEPEAKAEEAPEPAKPEPVEYKYELPESIKMDDAQKGELHGALDAFRADPAAGAQKLIDLHQARMNDYATHMSAEQHRVFNDTKKGWRDQVLADEMIGGSGHRSAMGVIAQARNAFVSDHPVGTKEFKADLEEFVNALDATGAGDHRAILKFVYRVGRAMNEPTAPLVVDPKPAPQRKNGMDSLYDNDRSPREN